MTDDSLKQKVLAWVSEKGYPFELKVAREFGAAGWEIDHAQLYADPETGTTREIDIIARVRVGERDRGVVSMSWTIECKRNLKHPWVVFVSRQRDDSTRASALYLAPSPIATAVLNSVMDTGPGHFFHVPKDLGHGITKAFVESNAGDPTGPFAALMGASSAAVGITNSKISFWLRQRDLPVLHVYMPAVVIDGSLFEISLNESGEEVIADVPRSLVWSRSPGEQSGSLLVNVVTAAAVSDFAKSSHSACLSVAEKALQRAPEIWTKFKEGPLSAMYL